MAKENIEPQPKLNLDGKEYEIDSLTDVQKEILGDIDNYQKQINKLERWKAGQIAILKTSIEEIEKQKNDNP
jgi:hypothetical protein